MGAKKSWHKASRKSDGDYWSIKWVSIIVLSLMSNLLNASKTITPRGKVELWLCNQVQGLVKKMMTLCIDNLLKVTKVGYTKKL